MAYQGSLGEIDLSAALQVLCRAGRSGVLSVYGKEGTALAILDDGRILFASSDRVEPLGHRFVEAGLVTPGQLDRALEEQRRRADRPLLGSLLVEMGCLSPEAAAPVLEDHIVAVLRDTLSWPDARVHFHECPGPTDPILPPGRADVDLLLLRAALGRA